MLGKALYLGKILMKLRQIVQEYCVAAFYQAFPAKAEDKRVPDLEALIEVTEARQEQFGHYQCNAAMKLTKYLDLPSREIALALKDKLEGELCPNGPFGQIDVAGPGFINLSLSTDFLTQALHHLQTDPRLGVAPIEKKQRVVVDFSSPNIAKEMHVGHLRSTILGDALCRLLSFLGYDVLRLNHLGDWGTQFGMLIAYIQLQIPNLQADTELPLSLTELVTWYRAAKQRFDADADFKQQAQKAVVALQQGTPLSLAVWRKICTISSQAYEEIYRLLSVELISRGESFYNTMLPGVVEDCRAAGLLKKSDGAQCLFLPGFVNREGEPLPLMIQKSDGAYNYATTDLAALKQRVQTEQADWIIYVTDAGQAQHFDMVFQAAKVIGYLPESVKVSHVSFGLVLRPDGKKFKTREGDTEKLVDLLTVAIDKAKEALQSRNPELAGALLDKAAKSLGINAVKYADLSCHRVSNYVFSYDKMLQFEGNTAAFLSYAVVRIRSIYRKTGAKWSMLAKTEAIQLVAPAELSLALLLCQFEDVLDQTVHTLMPHVLTDYLFRLAEKFHRFFHDCRVEGSEYQNSRLLICGLVEHVLCLGFELLGLETLEKM